jgi:hypothetical protein
MPPLSHILADNDENFGKLILFAIIIVIWAVRAIANVAKSSGQKKPSPPPMPAARSVAQPVPPPIQPRPRPPVAARAKPVVVARQAAKPIKAAVPPSGRRLPPLPSLVRPPAPAQPGTQVARPAAVAAPARVPARQPVPAAAPPRVGIARWADRQTVRSQFVLSEALQPPLALRTRSHLP